MVLVIGDKKKLSRKNPILDLKKYILCSKYLNQ